MYIVMCAYDDEISIIGTSNTYEQAYNIMKEDYDIFLSDVKDCFSYIENMKGCVKFDGDHQCSWQIEYLKLNNNLIKG